MFLHPFCCGLTSHGTVACEFQKKCKTPRISSNGASCLVSDKWRYSGFLPFFWKKVSQAVSQKQAAKDTHKAWFRTFVNLSWHVRKCIRCFVELGYILVEIFIAYCVSIGFCSEILFVFWLYCDCCIPPVLCLTLSLVQFSSLTERWGLW